MTTEPKMERFSSPPIRGEDDFLSLIGDLRAPSPMPDRPAAIGSQASPAALFPPNITRVDFGGYRRIPISQDGRVNGPAVFFARKPHAPRSPRRDGWWR